MKPGALLRRWRRSQGLSQAACARAVGVRQNTWSDWEGGRKQPQIASALRLHLLTVGACPVDAWCAEPALRAQWRAALAAGGGGLDARGHATTMARGAGGGECDR